MLYLSQSTIIIYHHGLVRIYVAGRHKFAHPMFVALRFIPDAEWALRLVAFKGEMGLRWPISGDSSLKILGGGMPMRRREPHDIFRELG